MFQSLREKRQILVTGPMRSGTTICAEMIAHDLGREALREEQAIRWPLGDWPAKYVPQVPYAASQLFKCDGWFVVIMQREMDAILKSSMKYFDELFPKHGLEQLQVEKQLAWMNRAVQHFAKLHPESSMLVNYDELATHPLWVSDRSKFASRQTRL